MEVAARTFEKDAQLMRPPEARPPPGPLVTVLDEDAWTEKIEGIIRRDFFPDLPKLENKLEWLQAVRSGDPEAVRQAQLNIAHRRAGMKTPIGATPANLATPGASILWAPLRQGTPGMTPGAATPGMTPSFHPSAAQNSNAAQLQESAVPSMSLDKFFQHHNSEDNASFNIIKEGEAKRRRAEKPWLFSDKNQKQLEAPAADTSSSFELPPPHDDRPNLLISWPHTNKSALYYDSSQRVSLALTKQELDQLVMGPPKQISHSSTRVKSSEGPDATAQSGSAEATQPGLATYRRYVATPSLTPGAGGDSPLMTWGEIDGTPLRLDVDDDIHVEPSTAGPQFKVPDAAKRDQLGRDMAQKARHSLQRKIQARMRTPLRSPLGTPGTPGAFGKSSSQLPMSPAARRLASSIHGRPQRPDSQLRASYRTPSRPQPHTTPLASHGWASPMPSPAPVALRKSNEQASAAATAAVPAKAREPHLTDDLLQL